MHSTDSRPWLHPTVPAGLIGQTLGEPLVVTLVVKDLAAFILASDDVVDRQRSHFIPRSCIQSGRPLQRWYCSFRQQHVKQKAAMRETFERFVLACVVLTLSPLLATRSCCAQAEVDMPPAGVVKQDGQICPVELSDPLSPSTPARVYDVILSKDGNGVSG